MLVDPDPRDRSDGTLWDGLHTALRGRVKHDAVVNGVNGTNGVNGKKGAEAKNGVEVKNGADLPTKRLAPVTPPAVHDLPTKRFAPVRQEKSDEVTPRRKQG